jgi:hypothetical protein
MQSADPRSSFWKGLSEVPHPFLAVLYHLRYGAEFQAIINVICQVSFYPHWVWWVSRPERLQRRLRDLLERGTDRIFGVSIISCWEVAKLVQHGRLKLDRTVGLGWKAPSRSRAYRFSTSIRRS